MRSTSKKITKRLLSMVLALTMVLGMLPFAALAAPLNGYNLTVDAPNQVAVNQVVDGSSTLTGLSTASPQTAYVTIEVTGPSGANPEILATDTTTGIEYNLAETGVWGDPGTGFSVDAGYSATTPLKLKFDVPGTYTATFNLVEQSDPTNVICSGTKTITVVGFNSLTGPATDPKPGENFTVTASTTATSGVVQFSYGSQNRIGAVASDGTATATFTAEAGQTAVVAILSGISGVDAVTATTTITPGAADTYYDVTFLPGAADAYIPFTPTTVSVKGGDTCTIPTGTPTRPGYVFAGWDSDNNGTADIAADATATGTVSGNMTLNAVWTRQAVTVSITALDSDVATVLTSGTAGKVGDTVRFNVKIPAKYNTADVLVWAGNSVIKYLSPVAQYYNTSTGETTLYYEFEITEDLPTYNTTSGKWELPIAVSNIPLNKYTVTMPVGHFTAQITAVNGSSISPAGSATVEYGGSYTFTVTPATGYTIAGVYVNGVAQTGGSPYTVTNVTSAQTVEVVVDAVPSYTVTYVVKDAQYTTQKVTSGSAIGTLPDAPVVEGYNFNGWNTEQNGGGTAVTGATTVTEDMTVYAQLTAKTYTIKYNANGGSGAPADGSKAHGAAVALSTTVPTWTGHTFLGWGTTANATAASYQPGDMYSADADITLYAVWQINTFTVTLPNGTGYTAMPATGSSSPVDYDGSFSFTVTVDPEYAVTPPTVTVNGNALGAASSSDNTYTYTISNIKENKVVSIQVTKNPVYTVTFMVNGSAYQTQQVEYGAKATQPAPPSVEGYTFEGWQWDHDSDSSTAMIDFDFGTSVKKNITLYAVMTAITPKVTYPTSGTGWTLAVTDPSTLTSGGTVTYKSSVEFTVTISTGYDATNLAVAANGLALAPVEVSGNTYKFVLSNITEDQKITVTGVARKMVTITYNDNGGIGGPGQEQVPMYVASLPDNGTISDVEPTRVGYEFLGWATTNDATSATYAAGANNTFTSDTTLYAVWEKKTTTVTLTVNKTEQYEGEDVTLTATVTSGSDAVTSGSVQFYRSNNGGADELIGTAKVSGGKAVLTIATSAYKRVGANTDSYTVKFIPDEGAGYDDADSSAVTVKVLSAAISWKLNGDAIADKANTLTIKNSSDVEVDSMTAGQEYTLVLPAIYALDDQSTKLTVNKDYTVTWQYCNASGTWTDYTAAAGTDSVKILAAYSQYVFRAVVTPLTGATGHFTKAAKYSGTALTADAYEAYLVTEATSPVAQQKTETTLSVSDTHDLGSTVAEFEGQQVTLTAEVVLDGTTTAVTTGEVYFFNGTTLIGKANVQTDGTAVLEATISEYDRTGAHTKDTFKAVYQDNATYKTSTSADVDVLIRSTAIVWATDTSGAEVKDLTVTPSGTIYADNTYTLTLPAIKEEGQDVTLTVGTDYVVTWYRVNASGTLLMLAENTQSDSYDVTPPTADVKYYAVVSPKAGSNYTDAYEDNTAKNFLTSEKTAESKLAPTITTLTFGEVLTDTTKTPDFSQYEGKTITITAKVVEADFTSTATPLPAKNPEELVKTGTVTFYVVTDTAGHYEKIGTAAVDTSGRATVNYTLPEYDLADALSNIEYIFAVYTDTDNTFETSNTTEDGNVGATVAHTNVNAETEAVQILSTTISWKINDSNQIVATPDANKLTIHEGNGTSGTVVDTMTAGSTYTLELPAVYALDDAKSTTPTALTVNVDYTVTWQYREFGTSAWADYPNASAGNTVLITPEYSGYQFQAVVTPIYDNDALTGYKTAAAYDSTDEVSGTTNFLVTDPTIQTERQTTTTDLAITGADNEAADVVINGATPFTTIGNHKAQFEGQTVTLTATVVEKVTSGTAPAVASGSVEFYQNGTLIATVPVETAGDNMGKASCTATMNVFSGTDATLKKDTFYAKYVENATYDDSTSATSDVYIKSTAIQTPVITSAKAGTGNATSTTYDADLTGLLAGVEHTFTLKTTGATTTESANWSVVALDGRTVASTDYTIKWLATTGANEEATVANGSSYTTSDNKVGDMFRVELVPTGNMKTGATSKYVKIGTKQDVTVTVTASDEIASTTATDVYQLNEITLTATVAAAEGANATVKPSGTVAFYYKNGTNWIKLGEAVLDVDTDGEKRASITTDKLPVTDGTNVKRNVEITAVYLGDVTFNVSRNYTDDGSGNMIVNAGSAANGVTDKTVTVYSSVVYVKDTVENKTVTVANADKNHTSGIYIYAEDDLVLANETNVNLKLSDVYTLDHDDGLSKLVYGAEADYTVQWQMLVNAAAYSDKTTAPWVPISGTTICQITVVDGAAYRAVITVNNTPIAKGSYTSVDQGTVGTADNNDGRQVYYSNILVAADAPATVTVNVNTSNTADGYEGIVEGEKVTIHTFTSGASGTTPISELTTTVTKVGASDPIFSETKTNVNGHVSFTWDTAKANAVAEPGYYTLTVNATFTNGYDPKTITRTLIVRDNDYKLEATTVSKVYNGKVQGLTVAVDHMDIEDTLAQESVVVYYYTDENRTQQVEPTQAGTYYATIRLQESAYWTEKTMNTTFTIEQREVSVVDLVAQAKVYDGTTDVNIQEIILEDAATDQATNGNGLPTGSTGVINGDSVYAIGTAETNSANVNEANSVTVTVTLPLLGDDAANYKLKSTTYTEAFTIQRSQVKGDIANSTFKYTGSNIYVPADDIYLIDQAGNQLSNYTVTYYYHNGDGVEKVDAMNKLGKYTVIARPEQINYKGGASQVVYVAAAADDQAPVTTAKSALIDITNTVELYGATTGIQASATNGATITKIEYYVSGSFAPVSDIRTLNAGRYLVKVTASTGDTAYGIYTIVKANPKLTLEATGKVYNSAQFDGAPDGSYNGDDTGAVNGFPVGTYYTYTGGTIQGVAYEAPTEVGTYIVTAHVPETANYTAHEFSAQFEITLKDLTITADSLQRRQYGAFPDMTASFKGLATEGVAADTSLRDVQIQPELIFDAAYSNDAMDQVGSYTITAAAALARNYKVSYETGLMTVTADEPNPELAIHGMIENGNGAENLAYYGDVIQLYAYGSQMTKADGTSVINNSSVLTWSVTSGPANITEDGLLTITGVGTVVVKLERGVGAQKISTSIQIEAKPKEVVVNVPDVDKVYKADVWTYDGTVTVEGLIGTDTVTPGVVTGTNTRTIVGSQITQYKVTDTKYVSETYGGLFTINDKEVTVKPTAAETVYGTKASGLTYSITPTGSDAALSNGKAVSVADLYGNLDVLDGYEILVAGTEDINYNVKYETKDNTNAATIGDVEVKPLALDVSTGTLKDNVGMTSGSLNPAGDYPAEGAVVDPNATLGASNVRMYGEPNWVMVYKLTTLIDGDSLADLADLGSNLVDFNYTIATNANITYPTRNDASPDAVEGRGAYNVETGASMIAFGNYTENYTKGTQNIYQRPVTLKLSNGIDTLDVLFSDVDSLSVDERTAYLRNLIVANLNVLKYTEAGQEVGGLATLLKHTANDLDYELTYTYNTSGFDVTIKAINNYWSENYTIHVNVVKEKYRVVYNSFTATSATVTLYHVDLDTGAETAEFLPSGNLMCKIFTRTEDGSYLGETPVVNVAMQRTSTPGVYTVTYPRLVGSYRMFAIAEGGVGYTIVNGIE